MSSKSEKGTLFVVATPIGNLADMSFRGLEVLGSADIIACEDTRHTAKLLNHFKISKKTVSYHQHNERGRSSELIEMLNEGRSIALVSDAGTPAINDPGSTLINRAIEAGISVVPVPGPAAFVSAVVTSGLPTDSIFFGGFLPARTGDRRRRLVQVLEIPATLVFYETPTRLIRSLTDCLDVLGDRKAAAARELTKVHEEIVRGTINSLISHFSSAKPRGELVLVFDRAGEEAPARRDLLPNRVNELIAEGSGDRAALRAAAKEFGISRSEAYRRMQGSSK